MEQRLATAKPDSDPRAAAAIAAALGHPRREPVQCTHQPPAHFRSGAPVPLEIALEQNRSAAAARLYYRHVNQAERYRSAEMQADGNRFRALIPAEYTDSPYPLQYYFEFKESREKAWLYPGFTPELTNQPYFVLRRA